MVSIILMYEWMLETMASFAFMLGHIFEWKNLLARLWMLVHFIKQCGGECSWRFSCISVSAWPVRVCLIGWCLHGRELTTALIRHFVKCHLQSTLLMEGAFNSDQNICFVRIAECWVADRCSHIVPYV